LVEVVNLGEFSKHQSANDQKLRNFASKVPQYDRDRQTNGYLDGIMVASRLAARPGGGGPNSRFPLEISFPVPKAMNAIDTQRVRERD
jgi:hypothetical protein